MSKRTRLAYIFPTNLEHPGLKIKYEGQLDAFQKKYKVTNVYYKYKTSDSALIKILKYLKFEFKSIIAILISKKAYIRYNPKAVITNFLVPYLTKKIIYLEFNTIFNFELEWLRYKLNNPNLKKHKSKHVLKDYSARIQEIKKRIMGMRNISIQ